MATNFSINHIARDKLPETLWKRRMKKYRFIIRDARKRVLADSNIEEVDTETACQAVKLAFLLFTSKHGFQPAASIRLNDERGVELASFSFGTNGRH
ncbi:hypothetical protein [Neorhizobium alkalisoli]|nr:hypothetical protein [Neorhizobium alkalisoli]